MHRPEVNEQYHKALKAGQKCYKDCLLRGRYPYPQVLDEILSDSMIAGRVELGIIEIPIDQIVGTKTEGRKNAFSANFMPLLDSDTEFAAKWMSLCDAHLGNTGIRDPIRCYEYLGRFYVQEGNKRVSVLKSYDAPSIPGYVTRLIPVWSQEPEVQRYYEFLRFYRKTGLYRVFFTQAGGFPKLQAALGFDPEHVWTAEERRSFLSGFTYFQEAFRKLGGDELPVTPADALLVWLRVYPFEKLKTSSASELRSSLQAVWPDVKVLGNDQPIAVNTEAQEPEKEGLFSRLVSAVLPGRLHVAFINERNCAVSPWTRAHEQGREYLQRALGDRVTTTAYFDTGIGESAEKAMEDAIAQGAQVLFTTTAPLIGACRKIAARHPQVKVLNCSISMPYTGVRTYYSRIYEGKFISGAIAGAMSEGDRIGYIASYPILGVPAGINAFALGAQLTNPRAQVELRWSCLPGDPMEELRREGIDFISTLDIPAPGEIHGQRGACRFLPDGTRELMSSPYWNWGAFYVKMVESILGGSWDDLSSDKGGQAVNYWWGMASGVIGLHLSDQLPDGVRSLAHILLRGITDGSISPFHRYIRSRDGLLRNDGGQWLTPQEILNMDWLCETVNGSIPAFDQLLPVSRPVVRLLGVYRDSIPPEKEGVLL